MSGIGCVTSDQDALALRDGTCRGGNSNPFRPARQLVPSAEAALGSVERVVSALFIALAPIVVVATVLTVVAALVLAEQALHEAAEQTVVQKPAGPIAASAASGRWYCCSGSSEKECCTEAGACCVVSCSRSCSARMGYCTFCSHRNSSAWLGRTISAPNKVAVHSEVHTWWAPHAAQIHRSVAPPASSCGLSSCNARCPHSVQLNSIDGAELGFSPRAAQEKREILNISSLHTSLRLLTQPGSELVQRLAFEQCSRQHA